MRMGQTVAQRVLSPRALVRRLSPAVVSLTGGARRADNAGGREDSRSASLGRIGSLEVRLAESAAEVRRAQQLRYDVFYREMSAVADFRTRQMRRDTDCFDAHCDHLVVLDHDRSRGGKLLRSRPEMVGTYRLLRQEAAARAGRFYSAGEYEIGPMIARHPGLRFLELGRSCVTEEYRTRRTVELLWHGVWAYVLRHKVDAMFGCASLEGTDPDRLALPLSFLHHCARAPEDWRVVARRDRYVEMNRLPAPEVDIRAALRQLPPLIKGYLRLGAFAGEGAVVDRQFGTTDVCIVLPVQRIAPRYVEHYGAEAGRYAV